MPFLPKLPQKHKYGPIPYFVAELYVFAKGVLPNSSWWGQNIQPHVESIMWPWAVVFLAGVFLQDILNPHSWIREIWRTKFRKFKVTNLNCSEPADDPKRLQITLGITFEKDIKSAELLLRVYSCTGLTPSRPTIHPIKIRQLSNIKKDQFEKIIIARLLIPHPGWSQFHSIWGEGELGTAPNRPSLVGRSRNVACLELTGPWMFKQTHKFYVSTFDYSGSPSIPGLYVQDEDEDVFKLN